MNERIMDGVCDFEVHSTHISRILLPFLSRSWHAVEREEEVREYIIWYFTWLCSYVERNMCRIAWREEEDWLLNANAAAAEKKKLREDQKKKEREGKGKRT